MKGLFSWGCEQLVPDEWHEQHRAACESCSRARTGTEQAFGWCLMPAPLALETISEGRGAQRSKDRRIVLPDWVTHLAFEFASS